MMEKSKMLKYLIALIFCLGLAAKLLLEGTAIPENKASSVEEQAPIAATETLDLNCFLGNERFIALKDNCLQLFKVADNGLLKTKPFKTAKGVLFAAGNSSFVLVSKGENTVYCFDLAGNQVWEKAYSLPVKQVFLTGESCYLHLGSPWGLAEETKTGQNFPREKLVALTLDRGNYLWEYNLTGETVLVFEQGRENMESALFSADLTGNELKGRLHLLDAKGKLVIRQDYGAGPVYAAVNSQNNNGWIGLGEKEVYRLTADGVRLWTKQFPSQPLTLSQFPAGGILIAEKEKLSCFDEQGQLQWEKKLKGLDGRISTAQYGDYIAVGGNLRVYLLSERGKLEKTVRLKSQLQDLSFDRDGQLLILDELKQVKIIKTNLKLRG